MPAEMPSTTWPWSRLHPNLFPTTRAHLRGTSTTRKHPFVPSYASRCATRLARNQSIKLSPLDTNKGRCMRLFVRP